MELPQVEAHEHEWDLIAKTFIEPKPMTTIAGDSEATKLALTGKTTYLFQCSKCSQFLKQECEGLETTSLDRLLDKVDIHGPEYILKNGKTYVILKQPEQPGNLPVR